MNRVRLEICAFSLEAAKLAEKAGADRIELCSNPAEGGTTPHYGLIEMAVKQLSIPVYPIIRPRGGDFTYSDDEFEMMKRDIVKCKELGCKGVATGILTADNRVDVERMRILTKLAFPLGVTFIRAFDLTPDASEALEMVIDAGCERILTSGQTEKAVDAVDLIKALTQQAGERIIVMPGSGVRANNIAHIIESTGVKEIHASARVLVPNVHHRVTELGFGQPVSCNAEEVAEMSRLINNS